MRIVYVIYLDDEIARSLINTIRLICNPFEKTLAHITVRGPYKKIYGVDKLSSYNSRIQGARIRVSGSASFFDTNQNTVFLCCQSDELHKVWHKPDYSGAYNPHITLYDGKSRSFAIEMLKILRNYDIDFYFNVNKLSPLILRKRQPGFLLQLEDDLDIVSSITNDHIDLDRIHSMEENERLRFIEKVCYHLSQLNKNNLCGIDHAEKVVL